MTAEQPQPGPAGRKLVRYGDGPDDVLPLSWAEHMLASMARDDPKRFGKLLTDAALAGKAVL